MVRSLLHRFFPCMTNVRIWLYRSSDSKKIKNSAPFESMRFVVTLDVHINPATSIIYPGVRSETEVLSDRLLLRKSYKKIPMLHEGSAKNP